MEHFITQGIVLIIAITLVPMTLLAVSGGIASALQAATQIQEQSALHLVRVLVFASTVYLLGGYAYAHLQEFFIGSIRAVEVSGRL